MSKIKENCFKCNKEFLNETENIFSSNPFYHMCLPCLTKIMNDTKKEISELEDDSKRKNELTEFYKRLMEIYNSAG